MKTWPILLLTILAAPVFAVRPHLPRLPEPEYADTEVSTNVVIAPLTGSRRFTVEISLCASRTNCVEVSVGCDNAPADTRLSAAETAFSAGWDCGAWFFASGGLTNRCEAAVSDAAGRRSLFLQIDICENDSVRNITLTEAGVPVFTNSVAAVPPVAGEWNLVKATSRGLTPANESISVKASPYGLGVIFR